MQELFDNALLILRSILRFRWVVLVVAWLVAAVGWAAIYQLNDLYVASARVSVDSNRILKPLLQGIAIQPDVDERIALMSQTLLNRPNLEKLARNSGLDIEATTPRKMEQLLSELGTTVQINGTRGNSSLYTVNYTHERPAVAKRVVQALIAIFIESTIGDERKDSASAQAFLDQQIVDYEKRLLAAERRLSTFKRENAGKMPGESGGYYQRLENAIATDRAARLELRETENRRDSLRRQVRDESPTVLEGGEAGLSVTDRQIQAQQVELEGLLVRYTDRHPRVSQLRQSLLALKTKKDAEKRDGVGPGSGSGGRLVPNIVYQRLRTQLSEAEARVAELEVRVAEYSKQANELRATVGTIPKVEAELAELDRDYSVIRQQHETLLERREAARLSGKVEQNVDDVKFRVIDPPFVPSRPSSPDKPLLSAGVFVFALGAGGALALAIALLRPVFYEASEVSGRTGRPVVGTISRHRGLGSRWPGVINWLAWLMLSGGLLLTFATLMAIHLDFISSEALQPLLGSWLGPVIEAVSNLSLEIVNIGERLLAMALGRVDG